MKVPEGWWTERLILRALTPEDANGPYRDWVHDEDVTRYLELRFAPPDHAGLKAYIAEMNQSPNDIVAAIVRKDTLAHIGNIRLGPIEPRHRRGVLGLLIGDRGAWGMGFGAEAIAAFTDHAFRHLGLEKLSAGLYAPNVGSRRAFEKADFEVEAVRRAHAVLDGSRVDVIEMARFRP